jgi:MoxR-like ATPase
LDRFLFKLEVTRNNVETLERIVLQRELGTDPTIQPTMSSKTLEDILLLVRRIFLPEPVANYIARLVDATHPGQSQAARHIRYGASPRAALSLASAARARALMNERPHTSFEDVRAIAHAVLSHRIVLDYNARIEGLSTTNVVASVIEEIPFHSQLTPNNLSTP